MQAQLTRTHNANESPAVLIDRTHFIFNAAFVKIANLTKIKAVKYFVDVDERQIAFRFFKDRLQDTWAVYKNGYGYSYRSSADAIINNYQWIKSIAIMKSSLDRNFKAVPDGKFWTIRLRPSFEYSTKVTKLTMPSEARGIYRLITVSKEVVYIGKGQIRRRISDHLRQDLKFDSVEYSVVIDEGRQFEAENYWLERYKSEHNGMLPLYNHNSGISEKTCG